MRTTVSLLAALCLAIPSTMLIVPAAQAGFNCGWCQPTWVTKLGSSGTHGTPNPSRNSAGFVGHFDSNGVPQSIVEPSDSYTYQEEVPCPIVMRPSFRSRRG